MDPASQLKTRARRRESAGDFVGALELYSRALRIESDDPDAMPEPTLQLRIADLRFRLGDAEVALGEYERAAQLYQELGLLVNAIAVWKKVARLYPERPSALRRLAELQLAMGLVAEARSSLRSFVEVCEGQERGEEVVEALHGFLDSTPDPEVAILLARELARRDGKPTEALETLERVRDRLREEGRMAFELEKEMRSLSDGS